VAAARRNSQRSLAWRWRQLTKASSAYLANSVSSMSMALNHQLMAVMAKAGGVSNVSMAASGVLAFIRNASHQLAYRNGYRRSLANGEIISSAAQWP